MVVAVCVFKRVMGVCACVCVWMVGGGGDGWYVCVGGGGDGGNVCMYVCVQVQVSW